MEIRLLGPLEAIEGDRAVPLGGPRQRLVLALLLVRANRVVPTDRLIHDLWGEHPPRGARSSLHSYISHLRSALGSDRIESHGNGYLLRVERDEVDGLRFEALAAEGHRLLGEDPEAAADVLAAALDLWQGSPFGDASVEEALRVESERFEELRLSVLEDRIDADLARGMDGFVVGELEGLVAAHPLRERLWEQLMLALYRSGRQAEALGAFDRARRVLVDELGIDPSQRLRSLHERILRQDPALDPPGRADAPTVSTGEGFGAGPAEPPRNPFKGLLAFGERDAADYFGREVLVERLVARLSEPGPHARFLAVVGPSGSGKSSLVRAGLVPRLREGALGLPCSVASLTPGAYPFEELEAALLRVASPAPSTLVEQLEAGRSGLLRAVKRILPEEPAELVLIIDQFEELFTLVADEDRRRAFLDALAAAIADPRGRLRVVVSLRADLYDRPLRYPQVAEILRARTEVVVPLTAEELERAITGPADNVSVAVEPALVAQVVADVVDEPGALPLFQYALTELFDRRRDRTLDLEVYRGIGGVAGALARRAEEVHSALPEGARSAARQVFLRLVTLGEGVADTRRRVLLSELRAVHPDPDEVDGVLTAFGGARLLSFDRDPDSREATVEIAHEALLSGWDRLAGWISDSRDDLRTQRRVAAAAREWMVADRDPSFLVTGARLEQLEAWRGATDLALTPDERDFLATSTAERDRLQAEEEERAAHEAELERRAWRRLRALVAVLAVAALIASGLTVLALSLASQRGEQARIATARELAAAAVADLEIDPERSTLLALEAVEATRAADGTVLPEAEGALHRAVKASRVVRTIPHGSYTLALSSDGSRLATTGALMHDNTARVWDLATGEELLVLTGPDVGRLSVALSPDDRRYVTVHNDVTTWIWDADTGEKLDEIHAEGAIAFSPDGGLLALGGFFDATLRIWDLAVGSEVMTLAGHAGPIEHVTFHPTDGTRLASVDEGGTVRIWDVTTGEEILVLDGDLPGSGPVAFSPDGGLLATGHGEGAAIWDAESGAHVRTLLSDLPAVSLAFSPDGTRLATGSRDSTAAFWDLGSGRRLLSLPGHTGDVVAMTFTPDGERLITSSTDNTTRVWDVTVAGSRDWLTVPGPAGRWAAVAFHPDGTRFAVPGADNGATIHDSVTGEVLTTLGGHDVTIGMGLAFSPDGALLAGTGFDDPAARAVPVWDTESGELSYELTGHDAEIVDVSFSPDGRWLVTSGDTTVRLWDPATGEERGVIEAAENWAGPVAFSPDGRLLAVTAGGSQFEGVSYLIEQIVFDPGTGEVVRTFAGHDDWGTGLAFAPDGRLVSTGLDATARVWDLDSGEAEWILRHDAPVQQVAVSPDGTRIATAVEDGTARLWDLGTGRQVLTLHAHDAPVFGVAFSPDGRLLATSSEDGTVALHLLPLDEFIELARSRLTRTLTDDECRQYLNLPSCP
jgi:WD40 repeat protein/DNA-binding SARP family transcriptional activator